MPPPQKELSNPPRNRGNRPAPMAVLALGVYAGLIAISSVWGLALLRAGERTGLAAPPLFAQFEPRLSLRILPAMLVAGLVVAFGHRVAESISFQGLLAATFAGSAAWAVSLAGADGWAAVAEPVLNPHDFYPFLPEVGDIAQFLRTFTDRIADYPIHVQGHPPGLVVALALLDRIGLAAPWAIAALWIAGGAAIAPAVLVAVRAVGTEEFARSAAPWLVVAPYALWIATSADALYSGMAAWGIALLVSAGPDDRLRAVTGGLLFGGVLMMTYGAAALALILAVVAVRRRSFKPLFYGAAAGAVVVLAFLPFGFWWLDGLMATDRQYYAGLGGVRPYRYFLLANLAVAAIACGPAGVRGMLTLRAQFRQGRGAPWLVTAAFAAMMSANLSGLSKGEVERIWLLFFPWLLVSAGAIVNGRRWWLGAGAASAIAVQVLVVSPW